MELTTKQAQGLDIALQRHKAREKYTVIGGYAGTGKSTLVKVIIDSLQISPSLVAYATFTGAAAEVLRKKGNKNAMTLHKLLYYSTPKPGGGYIRKPRLSLDYSVIVVDEVSMVPKSMINLLLHYPVYVIFLGDPFQLPQIDKNEAHTLLDKPHIFLDEIMRQAAESDIIQLTMKIRNGETIDNFKSKEVIITDPNHLTEGMLLWADQVIAATNATRISINNQIRGLKGFSGLPQDGDRMICLHNYWDDIADDGETPLVNGTIGTIHNPFESFRMVPPYIKVSNHRMDNLTADFTLEDGSIFHGVEMDKGSVTTGTYSIEWKDQYTIGKFRNKIGDILPKDFTFGYCVTGWKAQGSEWDKVLAIEENFPFNKEEHARFLYTACTRATSKLVLVRND